MPVKCTVSGGFNGSISDLAETVSGLVVRNLAWVGEGARNTAIRTHTYRNQTGNLESSTGYIISLDGRIVQMGGFETVMEGAQGAADGMAFAESLAAEHPKGAVLIVVAGKEYAAYVEANGYVVLSEAELWARNAASRMLGKLGAQLEQVLRKRFGI